MKDSYLTIAGPSTGEFRDRGSKFLAYAFLVSDESECQARLDEVKKQHPKARHHCYAYRLGMSEDQFRANDDGEPSGTAGRPILGQIDSFGLTHVIIIVVRYFGGTLLGTSGLINAYKLSARHALDSATVVREILKDRIRIRFDYAWMGEIMNVVKKMELDIAKQYFQEEAYLDIRIRKSKTADELIRLKALLAGVSLEEAAEMNEIKGVEFIIF